MKWLDLFKKWALILCPSLVLASHHCSGVLCIGLRHRLVRAGGHLASSPAKEGLGTSGLTAALGKLSLGAPKQGWLTNPRDDGGGPMAGDEGSV